jgi:alkyl hydroperoxide reductase subunit AhpC
LQEHQQELEKLGVEVAVVTFDSEEVARQYVANNHLHWPLLLDIDRAIYRQFGMGSAGWWTLLKPSTLWKYFLLWRKGAKPQKVGSDVHQLGGDVLIDPDGVLRVNHVSEEPHDRPSVESLLAMMRGDA